MINKPIVVICGAGQIGKALWTMLESHSDFICNDIWDCDPKNIFASDTVDFANIDIDALAHRFEEVHATYIINALPFHLNGNIAQAAARARCNYIDFTEDDQMAARVAKIYEKEPGLYCAPKCGLAPGFINYLGYSLVSKIGKPQHLKVMVGALPRHVSGQAPWDSYNLSWSVDGLVNEYIRPVRARFNGRIHDCDPLTMQETVSIDGIQYEAALTSGGIGSLVDELNLESVCYKTLRYPGHYDYIRDAVKRQHGDFNRLKAEFLNVFPFCNNDMIVVYAEAKGYDYDGRLVKKTFAERYVGQGKLTAIQSTTAAGGVGMLELMNNTLSPFATHKPRLLKKEGLITHTDVTYEHFMKTDISQTYYKPL